MRFSFVYTSKPQPTGHSMQVVRTVWQVSACRGTPRPCRTAHRWDRPQHTRRNSCRYPTCRTSRRGPRRRGCARRDGKYRACGCLPFPRRCARNGCTGCSGCGRGRSICPTRSTGNAGYRYGIADGVNAVAVTLVLEFAIALVHHADRADVVAFAEQQFQRAAAQFLERRAVGDDLFAVRGRGRARRHHLGAADDLDDAHAATAPRREMFQVTKRGDADAVGLGDLQNRLPFLALATAAINRQRDFFRCNHFSITGFVARVEDVSKAAGATARAFTPSEVLSTALNLQTSKHAPHWMQASSTM